MTMVHLYRSTRQRVFLERAEGGGERGGGGGV